jgi:hypothetical protein
MALRFEFHHERVLSVIGPHGDGEIGEFGKMRLVASGIHVPIQRHPWDRGEDVFNRLFSRFQSISFNVEHVSIKLKPLLS